MKYLKKYKLFEETENVENLLEIVKGIVDGTIEPDDINKVYDLDVNEFHIEEYDNETCRILTKQEFVEDLMGLEKGFYYWVHSATNQYNRYEYDVDDDELNYLPNYLDDKSIDIIKKMAKFLEYDINKNDKYREYPQLQEFLIHIGLKDVLEEIKYNISYMKENALETKITREIYEKLPINFDQFNRESYKKLNDLLEIDYKKVIKYLEDNKKNDIKTLSELIEYVGNNEDLGYDMEYDIASDESDEDYKRISDDFKGTMEKYWNVEHEIVYDELFKEIIIKDRLDIIKNNVDYISWEDKLYTWYNHDRVNWYLIEFAKKNSDCYNWFSSEDFYNKVEKICEKDEKFKEFLLDFQTKSFGEDIGLF